MKKPGNQNICDNVIEKKQDPFPTLDFCRAGMEQRYRCLVVNTQQILDQRIQLSNQLMGDLAGAEYNQCIFQTSLEDANGVEQTVRSNGQIAQES